MDPVFYKYTNHCACAVVSVEFEPPIEFVLIVEHQGAAELARENEMFLPPNMQRTLKTQQ